MSISKVLGAGALVWVSFLKKLAPSLDEKKTQIQLFKFKSGTTELEYPGFAFQHYPSEINDDYGVEYATRNIPGGSLPLYQWINGQERTISFRAMFSSDMDLSLRNGEQVPWLEQAGLGGRNVDIVAALTWLRSFRVPTYDPVTRLPKPPPMALLKVPGLGLGMGAGSYGGSKLSVVCVMTACAIEYMASFPTGCPRLAAVDLTFSQVAQYGGQVYFPGYDPTMREVIAEGINGTGGYKIRIR